MMRVALALIALPTLSTPAPAQPTTTQQFDLVCAGTLTTTVNGHQTVRPSHLRLSLDLDARLYVLRDSEAPGIISRIDSISDDWIVLNSGPVVVTSIDRLNGRWVSRDNVNSQQQANFYIERMDCTAAQFTPFRRAF